MNWQIMLQLLVLRPIINSYKQCPASAKMVIDDTPFVIFYHQILFASRFSHKEQVQVRLTFLTCVYSSAGSPDSMALTREQACILWNCLASDEECSDDLFQWFLNQAKSKEHHALSLLTLKHVFLEKVRFIKVLVSLLQFTH